MLDVSERLHRRSLLCSEFVWNFPIRMIPKTVNGNDEKDRCGRAPVRLKARNYFETRAGRIHRGIARVSRPSNCASSTAASTSLSGPAHSLLQSGRGRDQRSRTNCLGRQRLQLLARVLIRVEVAMAGKTVQAMQLQMLVKGGRRRNFFSVDCFMRCTSAKRM